MTNSVVEKYYDHLKKGQIIGHKCSKCGGITFPPTSACEHCGCFHYKDFEFSGKGKVHFISHGMTPPPNPRFSDLAPYAYGLVELEEGVIVYGLITNIKCEEDVFEKYYKECPIPVQADIVEAKGLSILAFKLL